MWLSAVTAIAILTMVLAAIAHNARSAAIRRKGRKRAALMRLRLQDKPKNPSVAYREVPIQLRGN